MGAYGRGAGRSMVERIAARTARATRQPLIFKSCELKSYDPKTGMVVVTDYSGSTPQDIGPMQYFRPWCGDGYGDEIGLEKGMHIGVLCVDREGHDYIAFGATFDSYHATLGVKTGERWIVDKLGSFIKWLSDSTLRIFGAQTVMVYGGTNTVLGADTTDATEDAVITKTKLDAWWQQQSSQLVQDWNTWAAAHVQPGAGGVGPTTLTTVASNGSSKVTAAP